jgi:hypothetical protein
MKGRNIANTFLQNTEGRHRLNSLWNATQTHKQRQTLRYSTRVRILRNAAELLKIG